MRMCLTLTYVKGGQKLYTERDLFGSCINSPHSKKMYSPPITVTVCFAGGLLEMFWWDQTEENEKLVVKATDVITNGAISFECELSSHASTILERCAEMLYGMSPLWVVF